ncbi:MAG: hypothetical protein M3083_16165 [Actinomycetota bacterium]|nr:hypothetical protein [Actinomycetota bacterium]
MAINSSVSEGSVNSKDDVLEDDVDEVERGPSGPVHSGQKGRHPALPILIIATVLVLALVVAAVVITSGLSKSSPKVTPTTLKPSPGVFVDRQAGFSLSYPPAWTLESSTDPNVPLLLSIARQGLDALLLRVTPLAKSIDTSSVANIKAFTDAVISGTKVTVLQQQPITVHGLAGYYYFYTLPKDPASGVTLVHSHFFLFPPNYMVSMTFQSLDKDFATLAKTFDQVVSSFRATAATAPATTTTAP